PPPGRRKRATERLARHRDGQLPIRWRDGRPGGTEESGPKSRDQAGRRDHPDRHPTDRHPGNRDSRDQWPRARGSRGHPGTARSQQLHGARDAGAPTEDVLMSFLHPAVLVALVAIPLLIAWYLKQQRQRTKAAEAFTNPVLTPSVAPNRPRWRRHVPMLAFLIALGALIVAA